MADKAILTKLISLVEEFAGQPGNDWFRDELLGKFVKIAVVAVDPKIDEIYELCVGKIIAKQAEGFYRNFPIKVIKDQLIADHREMEDFRRKNNFEKFCLAAYQQLEHIVNHLAEDKVNKFVNTNATTIIRERKNKNTGIMETEKLTDAIFSGSWITATILKEKLAKGPTAWDFGEKFKAVTIYYLYESDIKSIFGNFIRITMMGFKLMNLRNAIHRGNVATVKQKADVEEATSMKERHYVRFTSFLEEFTTVLADISNGKHSPELLPAIDKSKPIKGATVIAKPAYLKSKPTDSIWCEHVAQAWLYLHVFSGINHIVVYLCIMATFTLPYLAHLWRDMSQNDDPTQYEFITQILENSIETKKIVCWNLLEPFYRRRAASYR